MGSCRRGTRRRRGRGRTSRRRTGRASRSRTAAGSPPSSPPPLLPSPRSDSLRRVPRSIAGRRRRLANQQRLNEIGMERGLDSAAMLRVYSG